MKGLAETIPGDGSFLFENSRAIDWEPQRIATEAGSVRARHVVMATHLPLGQIGLFYTENYPHMHPVIMGRAEPDRVPPGMYISVERPRHSTRGHRDDAGQDWMIFTGPSFTHGDVARERESFEDLEEFARDHFGVAADYRWTNEDYRSMDHAPFVGWSSKLRDSYLVATGFNAWGISNGTAAAILIADLVQEPRQSLAEAVRREPDQAARRARRSSPRAMRRPPRIWSAAGWRASRTASTTSSRARRRSSRSTATMSPAIATRRARSTPSRRSAPIWAASLGWNETDRSWDCPCHGSRFALDGSVIHGPAVKALEAVDAKAPAET